MSYTAEIVAEARVAITRELASQLAYLHQAHELSWGSWEEDQLDKIGDAIEEMIDAKISAAFVGYRSRIEGN